MASLYKNNGNWYLSVTINGSRKCKSLRTKDIKVAKKLKRNYESQIIAEFTGLKNHKENLNFPELVERLLHSNHTWSVATFNLITYILKSHLNVKPLPVNSTINPYCPITYLSRYRRYLHILIHTLHISIGCVFIVILPFSKK